MHLRYFKTVFIVPISLLLFCTSCVNKIEIGKKPILEMVSGTDYLMKDTTLKQDIKYQFKVNAKNSEDQSLNTSFEVVRTYSGSSDTTMYYQDLKGEEQKSFDYIHTFTTLKKAGTERFTITVKNERGIVGQKILIFTVQ